MKILITIEGGNIQDISHDGNVSEDVRIGIIDYDTDGQDVQRIKQYLTGKTENCILYEANVYDNSPLVDYYFNELEKISQQESPTTFKIYYQTPETFRKTAGFFVDEISVEKLNETHVYLMEIGATDLNNVYYKMQGEIWSPNGEAREMLAGKNIKHTSMSIGDVIHNCENGDWYVVDRCGFKKLNPGG